MSNIRLKPLGMSVKFRPLYPILKAMGLLYAHEYRNPQKTNEKNRSSKILPLFRMHLGFMGIKVAES